MEELISGRELLDSGKITFGEINELLKRRLIDIYDSNGEKLFIRNIMEIVCPAEKQIDWEREALLKSKGKNNKNKLNINNSECQKRIHMISIQIGDFEQFSVEECKSCKFTDFNIDEKLKSLKEMIAQDLSQEETDKEIIPQWKINYSKLINFFIDNSSIKLNNRNATGQIYKKVKGTNCELDKGTIRKIKNFIVAKINHEESISSSSKKRTSLKEKNSFINITSILFSEWEKKHTGYNTIDWLKSEMKTSGFNIDGKELEKIISELKKVEFVNEIRENK